MRRRPGEALMSGLLTALVLAGFAAIAIVAVTPADPWACRAEGRRLTDDELARAALAYLRDQQPDSPARPRPLPPGYDLTDPDALLTDPETSVTVAREGDGPGDLIQAKRGWLGRVLWGERIVVALALPGTDPAAPRLSSIVVTNACGAVREDWGTHLAPRLAPL